MRALIVTTHFSGAGRPAWLLDELACALADAGVSVDVIVSDTKFPRPPGESSPQDGVRVFSAGPARVSARFFGKVVAVASAIWRLHGPAFRWAAAQNYDLCVFTSIGLVTWGLPSRLRAKRIVSSLVFLMWDFFPIHHLEIGRLRSKRFAGVLRALEARVIRRADHVGVMSGANAAFFRTYHPDVRASLFELAPWGSKPLSSLPSSQGAHNTAGTSSGDVAAPVVSDRTRVVFGGQLVAGRAVETLLDAMAVLDAHKVPCELVIAGDGAHRARLEEHARRLGLHSVRFVGQLTRCEYARLLSTAHAGVAVTAEGVSVPTFPSKIATYAGAGLAIVACLESASDAGKIVEKSNAGLAVPVGDARSLAAALRSLDSERQADNLAARRACALALYEAHFSADRAAGRLLELAGARDAAARDVRSPRHRHERVSRRDEASRVA